MIFDNNLQQYILIGCPVRRGWTMMDLGDCRVGLVLPLGREPEPKEWMIFLFKHYGDQSKRFGSSDVDCMRLLDHLRTHCAFADCRVEIQSHRRGDVVVVHFNRPDQHMLWNLHHRGLPV